MRDQQGGFLPRTMIVVSLTLGSFALAQVVGEEAEMERLEGRAEEAMANGDPESASTNMGKAALMASLLAKRERDPRVADLFRGTERLFRAQEQAYRSLALFEQAGGRPPASSGVCHTIRQAARRAAESLRWLNLQPTAHPDSGIAEQAEQRKALALDWELTIRELQADFGCE